MSRTGNILSDLQESIVSIQNKLGSKPPDLLVVAGSGFADAIPQLEDCRRLRYDQIPGFSTTTVPGHTGELILGEMLDPHTKRSKRVAILRGRIHLYEGHSASSVVHPIRSLIHWGCSGLVLTNAAGALHADWKPGSFMLIQDHINATGQNPLAGPESRGLPGSPFVDMTNAYDKVWLEHWRKAAKIQGLGLHEGTYIGVLGPSYETGAEVRALQKWGGDAVGMSTVLECIAARHMGARVSAISLLSNVAAGLVAHSPLNHQDVLLESQKAQSRFSQLIAAVLPML